MLSTRNNMHTFLPQNACDNCTNATTTINGTDAANNVSNETIVDPTVYARILYRLHFPHRSCMGGADSPVARPDPVNVSLPVDANTTTYTLQELMEAATDLDESYQFSVLFIGDELGYLLEGINGTWSEEEADCKWLFYYQAPDESEPTLVENFNDQVSFMEIEPNATVVMCYQNTAPIVVPPPKPTIPSVISPKPPTTSSVTPSETPTTDCPTDQTTTSTSATTASESETLPTMGTGSAESVFRKTTTYSHILTSLSVILCICLL